jgi:hypothetical protein
MIKHHADTHLRLLQAYRPLWSARAGSVVCGGILSLSILGSYVPGAIAAASLGAIMLLIGYGLGFPSNNLRNEMMANWRAAFKGTEWKTIGGEIATVIETDQYGNDVRLAFNGSASHKRFRVESLTPTSPAARELAAAVATANPYDKRFKPPFLMGGIFAMMIPGLFLPPPVQIGYLWLLFTAASYFFCGGPETVRGDDANTVRRLSKTKWRVLDGRVGVVRYTESRGTQDTGYTDYLTIGFEDGSEYCGEKSEMVPVHDVAYTGAA